jgi:hypothetical protein
MMREAMCFDDEEKKCIAKEQRDWVIAPCTRAHRYPLFEISLSNLLASISLATSRRSTVEWSCCYVWLLVGMSHLIKSIYS